MVYLILLNIILLRSIEYLGLKCGKLKRNMRVEEINKQIFEKNNLIKKLESQIRILSDQKNQLIIDKEFVLMNHFLDYIELGSTHTFKYNPNLNPIPTGPRIPMTPLPGGVPPSNLINFISGDTVEFVKKNQGSLIVKCTRKLTYKYDVASKTSSMVESYPNTTYRINIDKLYNYMMVYGGLKPGFESYVRRTESLSELGI